MAGGYQPLPVDGQQQPVQRQSLTCTQIDGELLSRHVAFLVTVNDTFQLQQNLLNL